MSVVIRKSFSITHVIAGHGFKYNESTDQWYKGNVILYYAKGGWTAEYGDDQPYFEGIPASELAYRLDEIDGTKSFCGKGCISEDDLIKTIDSSKLDEDEKEWLKNAYYKSKMSESDVINYLNK